MPRLFKLLLLAALLNTLTWITLIPVWQYPDEQAHFAQVQNIAEENTIVNEKDTSKEVYLTELALGTNRDGFGNNKFTHNPKYNIEYSESTYGQFENSIRALPKYYRKEFVKKEATHNPPLYYFLGSYFYKAASDLSIFERTFILRIYSSIIFLIFIAITYFFGKTLFQDEQKALVLAAFTAFMPMLVFASTGILPDPMTNLLFTLITFVSLTVVKDGIKIRYFVFALIIIYLGTLTRQQFLISLPICILGLFYRIIKENNLKLIFLLLIFICTIFFISFFIPSLSYVKMLSLPEIGRANITILFSKHFVDYVINFMREMNNQTFAWYWGVYRWLSLTMPPFVYQIIKTIILISIVGVIFQIVRALRTKNLAPLIPLLFLIFSALIYFATLMIWDYYFRSKHGFSFGLQGRYLFPMVVPHFAVVLSGIYALQEVFFKKYDKQLLAFLVIGVILLNLFSLYYLSASYYDVSSFTIFAVQASQYKASFVKGIFIILIPILTIISQLLYFAALLFRKSKLQRL